MKELIFKKEVEVEISIQAQKLLKSTKYSIDDFKNWALVDEKIALGGHNVVLFLESMYNKEEKENGSTIS